MLLYLHEELTLKRKTDIIHRNLIRYFKKFIKKKNKKIKRQRKVVKYTSCETSDVNCQSSKNKPRDWLEVAKICSDIEVWYKKSRYDLHLHTFFFSL